MGYSASAYAIANPHCCGQADIHTHTVDTHGDGCDSYILVSARLRGFIFCPGGSTVWPQCWLCAVRAVGHVGCCVGGGGGGRGGGDPVGLSISSSSAHTYCML